MRFVLCLTSCFLLLSFGGRAQAQGDAGTVQPDASGVASPSLSIGVPDRGRLNDPTELAETPHLFIRESRRSAQYGTAELVGVIGRAAAIVSQAHPGPRLVVGDLSRRRGGRFPPHRSHQSGRDADIGFYLLDAAGQSTQPPHFVSLRRDGCGRIRDERYCFDPVRNWALLAAFAQDETTRVQYVLIAQDIRRRVLAEGERQGAPAAVLERVRTLTEPHGGSASHRSHFHIRIYCPVDDRPRCVDEPPFHDWYLGEPAPATRAIRSMRVRQRRVRGRQRARQARRRAARQEARRRRARARRTRARAARTRRAERRQARRAARRDRRAARRASE